MSGWRPTPGLLTGAVAGGGILLFGVLAGRPEAAVLGLPLLLAAAWSWSRWPAAEPTVAWQAADQVAAGRLRADVVVAPAEGDRGDGLLALRVDAPGHRPAQWLLAARRRAVPVSIQTVRTGRRPLFRLDSRVLAGDGLLAGPIRGLHPLVMTVLPAGRALREVPLPARLQGLTGPHDSRRAGDGGDLHDVAEFRPGDRLRRIDWRVTARLGGSAGGGGAGGGGAPGTPTRLYVRRTFATADATVMLVVDSRDDVGPRVSTWGDATRSSEDEPTSLDLARFAAASLARRYLEAGDRVGLEDLGRLRRPTPPAGGRSHLQRLVLQLALATPEGEPTRRERVPRMPSGSLIVVFSTFLDDDAARMATLWRHGGHRVLAVDTLPPLEVSDLDDRQRVAQRIVAMERADRLAALAGAGVETARWSRLTAPPGVTDDPATRLQVLARHRPRR